MVDCYYIKDIYLNLKKMYKIDFILFNKFICIFIYMYKGMICNI